MGILFSNDHALDFREQVAALLHKVQRLQGYAADLDPSLVVVIVAPCRTAHGVALETMLLEVAIKVFRAVLFVLEFDRSHRVSSFAAK